MFQRTHERSKKRIVENSQLRQTSLKAVKNAKIQLPVPFLIFVWFFRSYDVSLIGAECSDRVPQYSGLKDVHYKNKFQVSSSFRIFSLISSYDNKNNL